MKTRLKITIEVEETIEETSELFEKIWNKKLKIKENDPLRKNKRISYIYQR